MKKIFISLAIIISLGVLSPTTLGTELPELTSTTLFQQMGGFKVRIKELDSNSKSLFQVYVQDRNVRENKKQYDITITENGDVFKKTLVKGNMLYEFKSGVYEINIICTGLNNENLTETTFIFNVSNDAETYKVTEIVDGDTFKINMNGTTEKVRIIGIDTPELSSDDCFSSEASDRLDDLINGENVILEKGEGSDDKDVYDRLLRYVYSSYDNSDIGAKMISEGYAYSYTKYSHEKQDEYENLEAIATSKRVGLWNANACDIENNSSSYSEDNTSSDSSDNTSTEDTTSSDSNSYPSDCNCSKTCTQMSSCEEAYYQLDTCGCTARDGDDDGVPCESLCQ